MFGPDSGKDGWKDLALMYERVRIRDEAICSSFLQIFESEVTSIINATFTPFIVICWRHISTRDIKILFPFKE
jgi:hypothetical protein